MAEKYKITTYNEGDREREWWCVTLRGEPINDEDLVDLLNSQSAEIAGLRETVEAFKWIWSRYERLDEIIK